MRKNYIDISELDYITNTKKKLIIDVRSEAEFSIDHIPGAINLPVLNNTERKIIGTIYKKFGSFEANKSGAMIITKNISLILQRFINLPKDLEIVVYCWRGGKRSYSLNTILNSIGIKSNIIKGGYKSFRKMVIEKLETLPKNYKFVVIAGPTGNGKTLLLEKLEKSGENIINLEQLANHYGSVLGDINLIQPTQKSFETHLLYSLSKLEASKICFIESESKKIGKLSIPDILLKKIRNSPCIQIEIPIDSRVENIKENYKYFIDNPDELLTRLKKIKQYIGIENLNNWTKLINHYEWDAFIEQMITSYYDPLYNKSLNQNYRIDFKIQSNENTFKDNINFIFDKITNLKDKI